ncbi:hypothetical protein ABE036_03405 [Priestia aryabhattai]|uniref:hypothetical protein n=1 Tax=Priestia TaxID=2800373 RepID=UPI0012AA701F|nr:MULTISPECIES: hypothetical protein [Priestia]MED3919073.1 hypothetical protein [Priestia aryabhattai]NGY90628.1 hypothetical protein [Priestia megaterium]QFY72659.1 hypothetical protein CEQ83_09055 [Priestia megaterium]
MKKGSFVLGISLLLCVGSLTGCSFSDEKEAATSTQETKENATKKNVEAIKKVTKQSRKKSLKTMLQKSRIKKQIKSQKKRKTPQNQGINRKKILRKQQIKLNQRLVKLTGVARGAEILIQTPLE